MYRMIRIAPLFLVATLLCVGCEQQPAEDLVIERLPDVTPSLPSVPTIPPDPYPIQLSDGSYTVLGVKRRGHHILDGENTDRSVQVTGYITRIFAPTECEEGVTCPRPPAPHIFLADAMSITDRRDWLVVTGYAGNNDEYLEAVSDAARGRYEAPDPETGLTPIPTDFVVGNKVTISGRLTRVSSMGFRDSGGLLDYASHETKETAAAE